MKYLLILLPLFLFCACNDEPEFPDPGLDMTRSVKDTVRRDTMDTYLLEMNVKALNGVRSVQILNGKTYELLDDVSSEYMGQTEFVLNYPIDLTSINQDTMMLFVVKVVDNAMRAYNKGFSLMVKKFSYPTIGLSVEGVLGVVSPVFELSAEFETGLNAIRSYKLSFEGEVLDEQVFTDTLIYTMHYSHFCQVDMEKGQDYSLKIELTDNEGQTQVEELKVNLLEGRQPYQVFVYQGHGTSDRLHRVLEFHYNSNSQALLDSITGFQCVYTLTADRRDTVLHAPIACYLHYNEALSVDTLKYLDRFGETSGWCFEYDENNRVVDATGYLVDDTDYDITVEEWLSDGRVKSFYRMGESASLQEIDYVDLGGYSYFSEKWVAFALGKKRQIYTDLIQVSIPTYLPALPTLLPVGNNTHVESYCDLLMYRYGFENVYEINDDGSLKQVVSVSFRTNINGELEQITQREQPSGKIVYRYLFNYEK